MPMPRIRKEHKEGFTTVGNELIQNAALSWKARGLMIYLLSMPQDWDFNLVDLANRAPEGRSALRSGVTELEEHGYVEIVQDRSNGGSYDGTTWYVYEEPRSGNLKSGNPTLGNPTQQKKHPTKETATKEHGASALAFTDAVPDEYGIYTATMTDESDEQVDCPHCANPIVVARQPNARGTCPHCEEGLRVNDPHGHIHKKGKRKPLTLGSLFADCPAHLGPLRVRVEQIEDLRMVHGVEPEHLWKAVRWSAGLVGKDSNTSSRFLIDRALVWARREANVTIAASGEVASDLETVPLPELRARLAGGELRMDDLDAGEQAVVLARLGALP